VTAPPLRLDHRSRVPLHAQVESLLRDVIRQPKYQTGQLLPDEVTLARQLGISRNTLRAGIARLSYEGLLERKAGVGTRVASRPLESGIAEWRSFTHEMERKGIVVQTFATNVRSVAAPELIARAMNVDTGRSILRLDRLRGWDDSPIVHFRSYLHPRLGLSGREDFVRPLYEIIEEASGVVADRAHEEMSAVAADATIAKLLRARRGTPLLRRNRTVYDAGGRLIEYAIVHYLSSRFALTLDLRRDRP
jgi:GntR family transcriptional regulator